MYNRYIPQTDGSYQKNRVSEAHQQRPKRETPPPQRPAPQASFQSGVPASMQGTGALSFLKQLLPRNFDTGDLLIVLLLLLMAVDCEEEKSTALLTLALYFFL